MSKRAAITYSPPLPGAPRIWRSIEERADPERRGRLAASEPEMQLDEASGLVTLAKRKARPAAGLGRRQFLTASGAAAATATLSGCLRRPVEHILPYARQPEYVLPGIPLHYATVLPRRGDAIGVIVESHEGRPTKIEGNPEHPASHPGRRVRTAGGVSHGGTDLQTQAEILNLYDIDRSAHVLRGRGEERAKSSWSEFDEFFREHLRGLEAGAGEGLRVLMEPTTSPTLVAVRQAFLARFPRARVHTYSPISDWNALEGARVAFGRPLHAVVDYAAARVIVSLECDFLLTETGNARWQRLFAEGRRFRDPAGARQMNRLYVVESMLSVTGANADHRLRLPSRDVGRYLRALARALGEAGIDVSAVQAALGQTGEFPEAWLGAVARDLVANRGRSVIVVGSRQPAWVHALAHALNDALGNVGQTVSFHEVLDAGPDPVADLRALVDDMRGRRVNTLLMLGGNPVYDAPRDVAFAEALENVAVKIHLAPYDDETSELCDWHLPMAHPLESWGDHRSLEGAYAIQQPLIAPLRGGRNAIEVLGFASGERSWRAYHAVRRHFQKLFPGDAFERAWRLALQRGIVAGVPGTAATGVALDGASVAAATRAGAAREMRELGEGNWEVSFVPDSKLLDGHWANNPWLLELPDPITKVSWDNAAMLSVRSAQVLGVRNGDLIRIERDGVEAIEVPVVLVPGMADRTIALPLGWGRRRAGRYATGCGFDVNPARAGDSFWFGDGYSVRRTGGTYPIVMTQEHHAMEGRPIVVDATVEEYGARPNFGQWAIPTPSVGPLWTEVDYRTSHPPAQGGTSWSLLPVRRPPEPGGPPRHAWGMTIDLTTCTGCNACVIACIAENNIPIVGKEQVARGREMHWLRIDRYFTERAFAPAEGGRAYYEALDEDRLQVAFQPVACQHCEEAPCENVCPVAATPHSPEGINEMTYNRCIGTRYCMNNCPYKVRRFNYLAFQGHVTELQRMQFNPNVSVRMRGVVEKCTYCIQRIQAARITARNEGRRIREGEVVPACAQACPSQAILFGDLNSPDDVATVWAHVDRGYKLLADVGTQPRTTFLGRVRNPNPQMEGV
jgi:molybdopterin-containing oxidoreductase family iron-sulfur binding subunit